MGPWAPQKVGLAPESFFQILMGVCGWKGITVSTGHLWDLKVDVEWAKVSPENPRVEVNRMGSMSPPSPPSVKVNTCTILQGPLQETEPLTAAPPRNLLLTSAALPAAATEAATSLGSRG